jgi:folylpolyglutamate synthase/dihydropteroate synthase
LGQLSRLHKQAQENLEHFREASREQRMLDQERHNQLLQQAEESIKKFRQELVSITQEKSSIVHQANKILLERDALQKSQESIAEKFEKLKSELSQLQKDHGASERNAQHWQVEYEKGQKKTDEQSLLLTDFQKQLAVLSQQVNNAKEAVQELTKQNKILSLERWEIIQEKAQLEGQLKQIQKLIDKE